MNNEFIAKLDEFIATHDRFGNHYTAQFGRDCKAEIERLSKPYVPFTEDELDALWWKHSKRTVTETLTDIETAICRRAGLEVVK